MVFHFVTFISSSSVVLLNLLVFQENLLLFGKFLYGVSLMFNFVLSIVFMQALLHVELLFPHHKVEWEYIGKGSVRLCAKKLFIELRPLI